MGETSDPLKYEIFGPTTGAKSTYKAKFIDFSGSQELQQLMEKIKQEVKRARVRLTEFFQDHDLLRKGVVTPTQFRSTLHSQKIQLTDHEYNLLEQHYKVTNEANAPLVNYVHFCEEIGNIFT